MATKIRIRKGQAPGKLTREEFSRRYRERFYDPAFEPEEAAIARLEEIAWHAYREGRKAPVTRAAGKGFANPKYQLSVEWLATRARLRKAHATFANPKTQSRVLIVNAAARNDGTCPGEISKSYRLAEIAKHVFEKDRLAVDVLDLSLLASERDRRIFPCKACVSTAMPLCHWPCSCYPNHSLGQIGDWMNDIYERFMLAHGVLFITPVYWHQAPSTLKLMMDRLVCADGGNPDPTSTLGKEPELAKAIEMRGWDYPQHLAGRVFGVIAHGDAGGAESVRRALTDWLEDMGLVDAGPLAKLDRYIGYYEPYATSHDALDKDHAIQKEIRAAARALTRSIHAQRKNKLGPSAKEPERPRPK
jgi:multimeric flavodoxin WrbA